MTPITYCACCGDPCPPKAYGVVHARCAWCRLHCHVTMLCEMALGLRREMALYRDAERLIGRALA